MQKLGEGASWPKRAIFVKPQSTGEAVLGSLQKCRFSAGGRPPSYFCEATQHWRSSFGKPCARATIEGLGHSLYSTLKDYY